MSGAARARTLDAHVWPVAAVGLAALAVTVLAASETSNSMVFVVPGLLLAVIAGVRTRSERRSGVLIALALVATVNGLPGPDLTAKVVKSGLYAQDFAVFALILLLLSEIVRHRLWTFFRTGIGRALLLFSLVNIAWWIFTLYRTTSLPYVGVSHAANFGRDFLYIAILTPLFGAGMQRLATREAMFAVVGAWSVFLSCVCIVGSLHPSGITSSLLHVTEVRQFGSVTRLYVDAEDLLTAALMFSFAFVMVSPAAKRRVVASVVAGMCSCAIAVLQTRAAYLGCAGGIAVASSIYLPGSDWRGALRRLLPIAAVAACVVGLLFAVAPKGKAAKALSEVVTRVGSVASTAQSSNEATSTVAVRETELKLLEQRLGGSWPLGLGFIDPRDSFDPSLPFGTIRNEDVGLFNTVMTMGVVGTVFYYLSLSLTTALLIVRARRIRAEAQVYAYGALAGCVLTLITSITLVTFFGLTGMSTVAAIIGLGAAALTAGAAERVHVRDL